MTQCLSTKLLVRHAGLEEPAPYPIRGHTESFENTGCARSLRSLRLPSVARLELIPMKIGAGMIPLYQNLSLWTDSIQKIFDSIAEIKIAF
jgi:hypothetical protein